MLPQALSAFTVFFVNQVGKPLTIRLKDSADKGLALSVQGSSPRGAVLEKGNHYIVLKENGLFNLTVKNISKMEPIGIRAWMGRFSPPLTGDLNAPKAGLFVYSQDDGKRFSIRRDEDDENALKFVLMPTDIGSGLE